MSVTKWRADGNNRQSAILDCQGVEAASVRPGEVQAECGRAAYTYIREAVKCALAGDIAAVATAPINKEAIRAAGVKQPGHTEILADLTGSARVCMMLASDELIVSMVTTHIGFAQVPERLTTERVLDVIELTGDTVKRLRDRTRALASAA